MHSYLLVALLLISVVNSLEFTRKKSDEWDFIVFAQQWPPSVCSMNNKCLIPHNVTSWTVHGIWPTGRHSSPSFCNDSLAFNVTKLKSIENELLVIWPNLFTNKPTYSFWKHEWEKHGTCLVSIPKVKNELDYFTLSITLHHSYNLKNLLENGGVVPKENKVYKIEELHSIIESQIGKKVGFECVKKNNGLSVIYNSYVCLDKNLALIDCVNMDRNCKGAQILYLPMKKASLNFKPIIMINLPYSITMSRICYLFSGMVLVLILVISLILIVCLKKHKAYKNEEVYKILPPVIEEEKKKDVNLILYA